MTFTRIFFLERKFVYTWGGTSSIFGGRRPRNALQWHRACYFILRHNCRLGSTILSSEGHKQWFGGRARPRNALRGAESAFYMFANPIMMQLSGECFKKYHTLKNCK